MSSVLISQMSHAKMVEHVKNLHQWQEAQGAGDGIGGPPFPPTFKLEVPGPGYNRKRVPAWTDRVLFRSQHVVPADYGSVEQAAVLDPPRNISDHNPIYASFEVACDPINLHVLSSLIRSVRRTRSEYRTSTSGTASSSGSFRSPRQANQHVLEQRTAFQDQVLSVAQAEVEESAGRLFDSFQQHAVADPVVKCEELLEVQELWWRDACARLERCVSQTLSTAAKASLEEERASNADLCDDPCSDASPAEVVRNAINNGESYPPDGSGSINSAENTRGSATCRAQVVEAIDLAVRRTLVELSEHHPTPAKRVYV